MEREGEGGAELAPPLSLPPLPPSMVHPILFLSTSIVLSANWELAGGKWSGWRDGQRATNEEGRSE